MYAFLRTFMPEYVVISVGKNNGNGHPTEATLSKLSQLYGSRYDTHVLRTDDDGDIFVKSNGKSIYIETSK